MCKGRIRRAAAAPRRAKYHVHDLESRLMFPLDALRFHFRRWRTLRAAQFLLPPASRTEQAQIAAFRDGFRRLSIERTEGLPSTEADWAGAMNRLRELALTADPRAFQRWDVIVARMACTSSPETPIELAALRAHPEWESRWYPALQNVSAGRPSAYDGLPSSSEILIQTVHHVLQLERLSGRRVDEWEVIVEFGGGFGGLCRVMHALGFSGRYMLFDLPPFVLLQRYYLEQVGIMGAGSDRVCATSELAELEACVAELEPDVLAAFWATWSLSETPLTLRERVKPLVERIGHYCIGYQARYGEVDNVDYFTTQWVSGPREQERIPHRPADYYIAGRTR